MPTLAKPDYACAIIGATDGRRLLQLRPAAALHAAGQLTCFGGRRESGESAELCLSRELHEELGWSPTLMTPRCKLYVSGHFMAHFFFCPMIDGVHLSTEPGHLAVWVPRLAFAGLPLSPWHRAVLLAVERGCDLVELSR